MLQPISFTNKWMELMTSLVSNLKHAREKFVLQFTSKITDFKAPLKISLKEKIPFLCRNLVKTL